TRSVEIRSGGTARAVPPLRSTPCPRNATSGGPPDGGHRNLRAHHATAARRGGRFRCPFSGTGAPGGPDHEGAPMLPPRDEPFALIRRDLIQSTGRTEVEILTGPVGTVDKLADIPLPALALVPYRQVRERGFAAVGARASMARRSRRRWPCSAGCCAPSGARTGRSWCTPESAPTWVPRRNGTSASKTAWC